MIKIVSYSTNRYNQLEYYFGIDIIQQFLRDNGQQVSQKNITIRNYPQAKEYNFVLRKNMFDWTFNKIPDIYQLEPILQMIKNYKSNADILQGTKQFFTESQWEDLLNLNKFTENFEINDGDIIGQQVLYMFFVHTIFFALKLKQINPNKKFKIVFGGYHITLSSITREFLSRFDFVDHVVIGDGRQPLLDIATKKDLPFELNGEFNDVTSFPKYSKIERKIRDKSKFQVITSFGCNNNCYFCASKRKHILFNLNIVKNWLIEQNKIHPIKSIEFVDDCINPTKQRLQDLLNMIADLRKNHNLNFTWQSHFYPKHIDEELVDLMYETGCRRVFLGTEIFNNKILKILNKYCNVEEYLKAIKLFSKYDDIVIGMGIMINLPGETDEIYLESLEIIKKLSTRKLNDIIPATFKLFPGNHFYNNPEESNIKIEYWDQELVDTLPEIKGLKIPYNWEHTNKDPNDKLTNTEKMLKILKSGHNYEQWASPKYLKDPDWIIQEKE